MAKKIAMIFAMSADGKMMKFKNDDPDFAGGANTLSLNEYRRKFKEKRKINSNYVWAESKT